MFGIFYLTNHSTQQPNGDNFENTYPLSPSVGIPVTLEMIESPQGGNVGDPGGNEMESEEMKEGPSLGQYRRCGKAWERV
jgi:hypothetical protein